MKSAENELLDALCSISDTDEMRRVLGDLLTRSEMAAVRKRWTIIRLLRQGMPQRKVAEKIGGSLCNVTRGARLLRNPDCASATLMERMDKKG